MTPKALGDFLATLVTHQVDHVGEATLPVGVERAFGL